MPFYIAFTLIVDPHNLFGCATLVDPSAFVVLDADLIENPTTNLQNPDCFDLTDYSFKLTCE